MTTALELVGVSLSAATLLIAAMFLLAFQLGRLITRDDEQREVEVAQRPEMAVDNLLTSTACSRRARSSTSGRATGAASGGGSSRGASSPSSMARPARWGRRSATAPR
jgi:hypothetical protein